MYLPFKAATYQLFTGDCIHKHILYRTQTNIVYIEARHDKAPVTTTNMAPIYIVQSIKSKVQNPQKLDLTWSLNTITIDNLQNEGPIITACKSSLI